MREFQLGQVEPGGGNPQTTANHFADAMLTDHAAGMAEAGKRAAHAPLSPRTCSVDLCRIRSASGLSPGSSSDVGNQYISRSVRITRLSHGAANTQ
jgi:hypothetical protein